jgi:hypothetical protein
MFYSDSQKVCSDSAGYGLLRKHDSLSTMSVEPLINCLIDNPNQSKHPIPEVKALLQAL